MKLAANVAVTDGTRSFTFDQLERCANRLAHSLLERGLGREAIAGVYMERGRDAIVAMLAAMKAGAAFLPLDPSYPADRLAYIVDDSRCAMVLTSATLRESARSLFGSAIEVVDGDALDASPLPSTVPTLPEHPDQLAWVIYTSGSSGRPKGVLGTHRATMNRFDWMFAAYPFGAEDVCVQKTRLSFVDSVWETFGPLLGGCPLMIYREPALGIDIAELVTMLAERRVSRIVVVPSLLQAILDSEAPERLARRLAALRIWTTSGEALPPALAARFRAVLPDAKLLNIYGSTEVAADVTCHEVGDSSGEDAVPIGRPIDGATLRLLDERGLLVEPGAIGRIYVGGLAVNRGYLGQPSLTAAAFVPDPAGRGARMYDTGDLGRALPDGTIVYCGRADQQVKIRGFRIELGEIERSIETVASVATAAVVLREAPDGDKRLVAYVVPRTDEFSMSEIRELLRQRLPDFMMPSVFVSLASMPLTPSGKIDRKALPAPADDAVQRGDHVAPRSAEEVALCEIFAELLGLDRIGVRDNFFELGGHSLMAIRLLAQMRDTFNVEIQLSTLFEDPTVETLAKLVELGHPSEAVVTETEVSLGTPIEPRRIQEGPVSFTKEFRFLNRRTTLCDFDRAMTGMILIGALDIPALNGAFDDVLANHSQLRAHLKWDSGRLVQFLRPEAKLQIVIEPAPHDDAGLAAAVRADIERDFDLEHELPIRVRLLRGSANEHLLVVTCDHLVIDAAGIAVFWDELERAYRARTVGGPALVPPPFQANDVDAWQRQLVLGPDGRRQIDYWREKLRGCPALEMPTDFPRPDYIPPGGFPAGPARLISATLSATQSARLVDVARRHRALPFAVLLAHLARVIGRRTGQDDMPFHSSYMHRDREGTERLAALLGNGLVMRIDNSGQPDFETLVRRTQTTALEAFANSYAPVLSLPEWQLDLPFREPLVRYDAARINFNYVPTQELASRTTFGGLEVRDLPFQGYRNTRFDYVFFVRGGEKGLDLTVMYNTALFKPATAEQLLAEYIDALIS